MKSRKRAPWWFIALDLLLVNVSMLLAYWMRYELEWFRDISYYHAITAYIPFSLLFTILTALAFAIDRVYRQWRGRTLLEQIYNVINATAKSMVVLMAITFALRPLQYSRLLLVEAGIIAVILLIISRVVYGIAVSRLRVHGYGVSRTIIVGAGEVGRTVMRTVVARPELGYDIVGFVDDDPEKGRTDIGRFKALGAVDYLPQLIDEEAIDEVIITLPWMSHRKTMPE